MNSVNDDLSTNQAIDGNNVLPSVNFSVGQKVRCIKNCPFDDRVGIAEHLRWHIGDEFIIESIDIHPWGTFLNDGNGHNLDANRAAVVS